MSKLTARIVLKSFSNKDNANYKIFISARDEFHGLVGNGVGAR